MNKAIQLIFANIFSKFKAKNPVIAGIIVMVLGLINYIVVFGAQEGIININPDSWPAKIVYLVSLIWGLVQGSNTYQILELNKAESTEAQDVSTIEVVSEIKEEAKPQVIVPQEGSILDMLLKKRIGAK